MYELKEKKTIKNISSGNQLAHSKEIPLQVNYCFLKAKRRAFAGHSKSLQAL